jgi:hypothetical protein
VDENRTRFRKAGLELLALISIAWFVNVLIEPDPPGVNVVHFSLKWFVYTYLMTAIVFVLTPFLIVLVVGSTVQKIVTHHINFWQSYRYAFIGAAIWAMLGNYGLWYGKSQQAHSTSSALPSVASQASFSPPGCEFAVVFPRKPEMTSVIVPGFGEVPEAEISDRGGLMRANCVSVSTYGSAHTIPYYEDRQLLLETMRAYAEQNGLGNVSYFYDSIELGVRARARGTKQLDGQWVTYETVWFVSPRSVMGLTAGHFSESYPTQEISGFLDSVTRTDRSTKTTSNESGFVMLRLPFEVAIDIPRDWWVLNDAINQLIRTSRDAALDLRGIGTFDDDETVLIAANSQPPTYAALRVTRVQPPLSVPEEVVGLTNNELAELKEEFETEMRQLLPLQGLAFLEATGIDIEEIGGWPAIVFSYRRSGPRGPVFVELIQVVRRLDSLQINLSYREHERVLWMPVVTRITQSIRAR